MAKTIQIFLKQDVKQLGKAHALVNVKAGYARNYLIPNELAIIVTPSILKQVNRIFKSEQRKLFEVEQSIKNLLTLLQNINKITLKKRIGKHSSIFGTVTDREVALALSDLIEYKIDKKLVELPDVKTTGCYAVKIKLSSNTTARINILILPTTIVS